jgi:hypothetical protein
MHGHNETYITCWVNKNEKKRRKGRLWYGLMILVLVQVTRTCPYKKAQRQTQHLSCGHGAQMVTVLWIAGGLPTSVQLSLRSWTTFAKTVGTLVQQISGAKTSLEVTFQSVSSNVLMR